MMDILSKIAEEPTWFDEHAVSALLPICAGQTGEHPRG
jgi:hypothetical protein